MCAVWQMPARGTFFGYRMAMTDDALALAQLMRARFSCRAFLPDPVPEATIARIVEASRWAASWSNVQPWEMLITQAETTRRLADLLVGLARAGEAAEPDVPYPPGLEGVHLQRPREVGFG